MNSSGEPTVKITGTGGDVEVVSTKLSEGRYKYSYLIQEAGEMMFILHLIFYYSKFTMSTVIL